MIAVIRVRFGDTPAEKIWSDEAMNNWLNPAIPFSLAHYWTRTSLYQADMRYYLFPPVAMADPRADIPAGGDVRQTLGDGVLKEVTRLFSPDWSTFDQALLIFAQPTDLFGGGSYMVSVGGTQKSLPIAVCDIASMFSQIVQEVGHSFGLNHEVDGAASEYMSPYSAMSSEAYGGAQSSFQRPEDPRFPKGLMPGPDMSAVYSNDVLRISAPYITPAQFFWARMGTFLDAPTVYGVSHDWVSAPQTFTLTALDAAIAAWPLRKPLLAMIPPVDGGDFYLLELRRNQDYDRGFTLDGKNGAPVAVVIHSVVKATNRVRYVNRIPLLAAPGDQDYHCFEGSFAVRLNSFADDLSSCSVTVGGGDFWKFFKIGLDSVVATPVETSRSGWTPVEVSPCFMFPKSTHQFQYTYFTTTISLRATSDGYEQPNYQWSLNDQLVDPSQNTLALPMNVRKYVNGSLGDSIMQSVTIGYTLSVNALQLTVSEPWVGISLSVKVAVNETSPDVLKNVYPDRSIWTSVRADNIQVSWDQGYLDAQKACNKRLMDVNDHYSINQRPVPPIGPDPEHSVDTGTLINVLRQTHPEVATVVEQTAKRLRNIP